MRADLVEGTATEHDRRGRPGEDRIVVGSWDDGEWHPSSMSASPRGRTARYTAAVPETGPRADDATGDPAPPPVAVPTGHVVVCGLDHLGLRTVEELRLRDQAVVIVAGHDQRAVDPERLGELTVIRGDQRHEGVLRAAGVERAAAIVLTADDDLANLHAALAAAELNPAIRIVMRLFDAELGTRIQSSSSMASPLLLGARRPGFRLGRAGRRGRRQLRPGRPGLHDEPSTGDAAPNADAIPIARLRADRSVDMLPDAAPTEPGLILVKEAADDRNGGGRGSSGRPVPGQAVGLSRFDTSIRDRFMTPDRRLLNLVAVDVVLAVISALFFQLVASYNPIDALSYAFSLLTGAGSGLSNVDPAGAPLTLRVYAILLSLCGAAVVGVVYALITDAIIGSRLLRTLGRRPIPTSIRDHVIVCGLGAVGYRIALGIAERGVRVVAVDLSETGRFVSAARAAGVPVLVGDARQPEILQEAGVRSARAVVAVTTDDLVNLQAALNARAVRAGMRVVVRVFDPDFAVRVQRGFKIRFTRSVSHLAAPAFASAALGSEVLATVPVGDRRVVLSCPCAEFRHVSAGRPDPRLAR